MNNAQKCKLKMSEKIIEGIKGKPYFQFDEIKERIYILNVGKLKSSKVARAAGKSLSDSLNKAVSKFQNPITTPVFKVGQENGGRYFVYYELNSQQRYQAASQYDFDNQISDIIDEQKNLNRGTLNIEDRSVFSSDYALMAQIDRDREMRELEMDSDNVMFHKAIRVSLGEGLHYISNLIDYSVDNTSQNSAARDFMKTLSESLGVDYDVIAGQQAKDMLNGRWKGEQAFFYNNKVYFVGDNISLGIVFHEFSHPFLRKLRSENKALFLSLYNRLMSTSEGKSIISSVKEDYPELNFNSDDFIEEVLAHAMQFEYEAKKNKLEVSKSFSSVISDLIYAIKKIMREVFGKGIQLSSLSTDTTLAQLAEMLEKGNIVKDKGIPSYGDLVSYYRDLTDYVNAVNVIDRDVLFEMIDKTQKTASIQSSRLLKTSDPRLKDLKDVLSDEFNKSDLSSISSDLKNHVTGAGASIRKDQLTPDELANMSRSFVDTLFRLDSVFGKVNIAMKDIASSGLSSREKTEYFYSYMSVLKKWRPIVSSLDSEVNKAEYGLSTGHPLLSLISNLKRQLDQLESLVDTVSFDTAKETIYEVFAPFQKEMVNKFDKEISSLKKRNVSQPEIDKRYVDFYGMTELEFNEYSLLSSNLTRLNYEQKMKYGELRYKALNKGIYINEDKIEALLKGQLKDMNVFESWLIGAINSSDPVVSATSVFVKNQITSATLTAQKKHNDFIKSVSGLLNQLGYNPTQSAELGEKLTFTDEVGSYNPESKTLEKKEVKRFLSKFKNDRYEMALMKSKMQEAYENYNTKKTDESWNNYIEAKQEYLTFEKSYFNRPFKREYYDRFEPLTADSIGQKAWTWRENHYAKKREIYRNISNESDYNDPFINNQLDSLQEDYRQAHSFYYVNGKKKQGEDLQIAERLIEIRKVSMEYTDSNLNEDLFNRMYLAYEQEVLDNGIQKGSNEYNEKMDSWLRRNSVIKVKEEFYTHRAKLIEEMNYLLKSASNPRAKSISDLYADIFDRIIGFRDSDGNIAATEMTLEQADEIRKIDQKIEDARRLMEGANGLNKIENARLKELQSIIYSGNALNNAQQSEINALYSKVSINGLSEIASLRVNSIISELSNIQYREFTPQYIDSMNGWMSILDSEILHKVFGQKGIGQDDVQLLLEDDLIEQLISQDVEFETWFKRNHIRKMIFDRDTQEYKEKWQPTYIWSVVRPSNPNHIESHAIYDNEGNLVRKIDRVPSTRFYDYKVKDEYITPRIVGETVNSKGQWLPLTMEAGAVDDRFQNKAYYELEKTNKTLFSLLKKITEYHLSNQEGLSDADKLDLDIPRVRKKGLEKYQNTDLKTVLKTRIERAKGFIKGESDDSVSAMHAANYSEDLKIAIVEEIVEDGEAIPIDGLFDIDINDVSTDVLYTTSRYMLSAELNKSKRDSQSVVRAIQGTVNSVKNNKHRSNALNGFIEREFEGQFRKGFDENQHWLNNTMGALQKAASFGFFAFNIPSALKNQIGPKFQATINSAGGRYMSLSELAKGEVWAYKTMGKLSFGGNLYSTETKPLELQMVDIFDPVQGRFNDKISENMTRSFSKDIVNGNWPTNFRKWTELQASLQLFGGYMNKVKVTIKNPVNGSEKIINYIDAWEIKDGQIQIKPGVDPEYGISYTPEGVAIPGKKFLEVKNKVHSLIKEFSGNFAQFSQPEANRLFIYRVTAYMRKYFTSMFIKRFGYAGSITDPRERFDVESGEFTMGDYIRTIKWIVQTIKNLDYTFKNTTADEKSAALTVVMEFGGLMLLTLISSLLFGYDEKDKDRFKKIKERSGHMTIPFFADPDEKNPFNLGGHLTNHALALLLQVRAENKAFVPLPTVFGQHYGLKNYRDMTELGSIAFGPTVDYYLDFFKNLGEYMGGGGRYSRESGPFNWQEKGGPKFVNSIMKSLGVTGNITSSEKAVKSAETQNMSKKM